MSLLGRTAFKTVAGKRFFSAAVAPKVAIAQNIILLQEIAAAADEATLTQITARGATTADAKNHKSLEELAGYFSLSGLASGSKFVNDPTAWQNMSFGSFAVVEAQRAETWPFLVGFLSVIVLLGFGVGANLPGGESRKNSRYIQMLEGKAHGEHH